MIAKQGRKHYLVTCCGCGYEVTVANVSELEGRGWTISGDYVLCGVCSRDLVSEVGECLSAYDDGDD